MSGSAQPAVRLERSGDHWVGRFRAMASPCEILASGVGPAGARRAVELAMAEAWRIERKFSRYRDDNIIHEINHSEGHAVEVDDETARLIAFADQAHRMSEGAFDITAGVLRRVWNFDGSDRLPDRAEVASLLPLVGWHQVEWDPPILRLPKGMQIDLGGVGKEYAVDRVASLLDREHSGTFLVNFGGDMRACAPPAPGQEWEVGIESPHQEGTAVQRVSLSSGGIATSGDARRFLVRDGIRYGHILDPRSGWPVPDAPRSVTVAAGTCTEAGFLSTVAMLQGRGAKEFLREQQCPFWCLD